MALETELVSDSVERRTASADPVQSYLERLPAHEIS
jgi:hypothetical protein